jgi:F-type H+-transporting ATPase subunit b
MSLLAVSTSAVISRVTGGALAEGAVTVDLDLSLFVHLGFFLVLLFVLKPALFDPMMRLFEEREKKIDGTRYAAGKEDEKSAKAHAKAQTIVAKGRDAGALERERLRAEGLKREAELMNEVRAEVAATLERGRAEISSEAATAKKELRAQSRDLGREIAARVLGREVAS